MCRVEGPPVHCDACLVRFLQLPFLLGNLRKINELVRTLRPVAEIDRGSN